MAVREWTGGYSQPLVMGLTPWNRTRVTTQTMARSWPPDVERDRLQAYEDFTALIENRPEAVFENLQMAPEQKTKLLIAVALPELICNVWADSVWNDPPTIELPTDPAQVVWQTIDEASNFTEVAAWESVFSAAAFGTSVIRLFRSDELGEITGSPVQIEEIDPGIYFPKLRPGSSRMLDYVVLAWEENRPKSDVDETWQVREVHALEGGKYVITKSERRAKGDSDFKLVKPPEITDLDFLPFVELHAKRWRRRYWGMSELTRILSLVDEIDNTLSNIAEILEYHGKPMLQVPAAAMFGGVLAKGADRSIAIQNADLKDVARYITYDGELASQLASVDKLAELIFLTVEIPRTYFGFGPDTGGAPSGVALKLMLQNYLKKAGRWQRNETMRTKTVVDFALRIEGSISDPIARIAEITHGSPLPADDEQEATIEQGLHAEGLSSTKASITRLRRFKSEKEVDEEIQQIDDEKAASVAALPAPFAANAGGAQGGQNEPPDAGGGFTGG